MPPRPLKKTRTARLPAPTMLGWVLAVILTNGCGEEPREHQARQHATPSRGYILISLDSLAARRLGAYGYHRDTSPFFDRLADRGQLFETTIAQSPSTLVSHLSLMTGLYPQQHGVDGPRETLSAGIETLAERFSRYGFATAGHTEGGLVGRNYGFHRGFDEFTDSFGRSDTEIEATLASGLAFLRGLEPEDRFFLFLHSYSVHHPYEPPDPYRSLFLPTGGLADASGDLSWRAFNAGFLDVEDSDIELASALYDGSVRYVDDQLEGFFTDLQDLGLLENTTIVITSDHGEEFLEHRRLGHSQVYPEDVQVPLLVLEPGATSGRRIPELTELIDVAPTLYDLAGIPTPADLSGESLLHLLRGGSTDSSWAYSESLGRTSQRSLFSTESGVTHQVVITSLAAEPDGIWVTKAAGFETTSPTLAFSIASFNQPRLVRLALEDEEFERIEAGARWSRISLDLPGERSRYRLDLSTEGCNSPRLLGLSDDPRCLSFKLRGLAPRLRELFRLDQDPRASQDLGSLEPDTLERLSGELSRLRWSVVAPPQPRPLSEEIREPLRLLGAVD